MLGRGPDRLHAGASPLRLQSAHGELREALVPRVYIENHAVLDDAPFPAFPGNGARGEFFLQNFRPPGQHARSDFAVGDRHPVIDRFVGEGSARFLLFVHPRIAVLVYHTKGY